MERSQTLSPATQTFPLTGESYCKPDYMRAINNRPYDYFIQKTLLYRQSKVSEAKAETFSYFVSPWGQPWHLLQSPEQEQLLPDFLSLTNFIIIAVTAAITMSKTAIVPIFAFKKAIIRPPLHTKP